MVQLDYNARIRQMTLLDEAMEVVLLQMFSSAVIVAFNMQFASADKRVMPAQVVRFIIDAFLAANVETLVQLTASDVRASLIRVYFLIRERFRKKAFRDAKSKKVSWNKT